VLNVFFLAIATVLVVRFLRTGGPAMLRAMSAPPHATASAAVPAVYTCPMHPEIERHEAGTCPICGMDLVERGPTDRDVRHVP
jgi:hypothetical protein